MKRLCLLLSVLALAGISEAHSQARIVTGRVTDSLTSEILTSGQVSVVGTTISTTVTDDGTFTIGVPTRDVTLIVRSIGYKRQDVNVPASQNSVQVSLARDFFQLEAIVVTGQATGVERRNLANAVASVTADKLVRAPTASFEQSLQGKLAGAHITQNSGAPGGGLLVRLRGVTSINGAFTPLYVIDGVIISDVATEPGTNFITQAFPGQITTAQENQVNRIADLNPNDISSIEVLKGASASAIYGSKASNGVVIITTKRGRVGAPQFSLSQRFGISDMSNKIGSRTWTQAEATAFYGALASDPVAGFNSTVHDHEEYLAGNSPLSHETTIGLSGGTETTRYFASGLVKHDGGVVTGTFYDKQSVRLNLDQDIGSRVQLSISSQVIHSRGDRGLVNNENSGTSLWSAISATPSYFDLRAVCPDGSRQPTCEGGVYPFNPYSSSNPLHTAVEVENRENLWRSIGTSRLDIDVLNTPQHSLRLIGTGGVDFFTQKNSVFAPPELQFEGDDGLPGSSGLLFVQNLNTNVNANAVYTYRTAGGTSATTQVGLSYEIADKTIDRTLSQNLVGGLRISSAGTTITTLGRRERVEDFGFFAQEEFLTLDERLLLTLGVRADQSSNNGDPDKLFWYPKASASYRLIPRSDVVEELKLRVAFGQSGNRPKWGQKFTELEGLNIGGVAAARLANTGETGDPNLEPERSTEIEGGIDAQLFNSRLNLEITAYEKRVSELLLERALARSSGFETQIFNGGKIRNRGIELQATVLPVQTSTLQWSANANFSLSRCKVTELQVPDFLSGSTTFGAISTAVDGDCTQLVGRDSTPTGAQTVADVARQAPDYLLGFSSEVTYKSLGFYFLLDHQKGGTTAQLTKLIYDFNGNSVDQVVANDLDGTTGDQRASAFSKCGKCYLEDLTFWKLREVRLSFDVPRSFINNIWSGARYVRLNLSGRNLVTMTDYTGMDPEWEQVPGSIAAARSWEIWAYPPSRSFWFSIDVGF